MIAQYGTLSLSRSRLKHNVEVLRRQVGAGTMLCATIKANAYGHGVGLVAELLWEAGVRWVCVYSLEEAAAIEKFAWDGVLVLAPFVAIAGSETVVNSLDSAIRLNVTDVESVRRLSVALGERRVPLNVHVQIDTGLTRAGVEPEGVQALVDEIHTSRNLRLEGVFAHLSHGDVREHETLEREMAALLRVAAPLKKRWPKLLVHLQNSGGAFHLPAVGGGGFEMVRCGIAVYGLQASMRHRVEELLPVARLTAPILAIHERAASTGVGYGHTFVTGRASRLAIVPVGYADGYPRGLSNRAVVQVRGQDVPVVGRVSMDQIIVDVTDVPEAGVGEEVVVVSDDPMKANCVDRLAEAVGTIGYELATHWGARLRRVVVE
jgi:alanine racemase